MINVKKIIAAAVAAACVGGIPSTAYAAETLHDWTATYRNLPGAPSSAASVPDEFTLFQNINGATAQMMGITNTVPGGESTTIITCENYTMNAVSFKNYELAAKPLLPITGSPTKDIEVIYRVSVSTYTTGNVVVSTGRVKKK